MLTMTEIVFKMIAIILEYIVVFVLDFPASTTGSDDGCYVVVS